MGRKFRISQSKDNYGSLFVLAGGHKVGHFVGVGDESVLHSGVRIGVTSLVLLEQTVKNGKALCGVRKKSAGQ